MREVKMKKIECMMKQKEGDMKGCERMKNERFTPKCCRYFVNKRYSSRRIIKLLIDKSQKLLDKADDEQTNERSEETIIASLLVDAHGYYE